MKAIATILAALAVVVAAILAFAGRAPSGPEAILYGRDACARCNMIASRAGFGGELLDAHGLLTKYDDVGCLLVAMWAMHDSVPGAWVEDHAGAGFVPLVEAWFVAGDAQTPMGYGVLAFRDEAVARAVGVPVRLEEILRDKARFQRPPAHAENP